MGSTPTATTQIGPPSKQSELVGLLYSLGIAAAAIFVKNQNHQQTASTIITVLNAELPNLENLIS